LSTECSTQYAAYHSAVFVPIFFPNISTLYSTFFSTIVIPNCAAVDLPLFGPFCSPEHSANLFTFRPSVSTAVHFTFFSTFFAAV
jgi:hypothetical protein